MKSRVHIRKHALRRRTTGLSLSPVTFGVIILFDVAVTALMILDSPATSLIAFGLSLVPVILLIFFLANGAREKKKVAQDGKEKITA